MYGYSYGDEVIKALVQCLVKGAARRRRPSGLTPS